MKKKILSFMTVLLVTCSVYMTAFAEGESSYSPLAKNGGTAAELKSYGKIVYQKGTDTIKIDSDDLYMLADQIDQVKVEVTDQLEAMNTYFSTGDGIVLSTSEDINVVHAKPYEEDFVDPLDVNFDTLLEGIAVSQSVSQDVTAYGYPEGTELYKSAEGILTTDGSGKNTEKISVVAATTDDLSAGTAAWINGELLLGTGINNQNYYERGYEEGYDKVSGQIGNVDFIQYGGDLTVRDGGHSYLGPCDIYIPNKDVWVLLAGPVSPHAQISPAPSARKDYTYLSMVLYRKNPNLPDNATRTLHVADSGDRTSGYAAPWYILYMK